MNREESSQGTERILECPNCGRQVSLGTPRIGGTFVVRCQSGEICHDEMLPVGEAGRLERSVDTERDRDD